MRTKTPKTNDRRVQRTDGRLHAAFISLVHERDHGAVTIRDVVQRAGVGRSTFYTHFADLEEMHGHWLMDFAVKERKRGSQPVFGFTRAFLEHAHGQRRAWRGLAGKKGGPALRQRLRRNLLTLVREEVARLAPKQRPVVVEGIVHSIAGAFAELLFWWIDSPKPLSPSEVDALFQRLTASALALLQDNSKPATRLRPATSG